MSVGNGAMRELAMVLLFAVAGLLLALAAAFTPWYGDPAGAEEAAVVELHTPPAVELPGPPPLLQRK